MAKSVNVQPAYELVCVHACARMYVCEGCVMGGGGGARYLSVVLQCVGAVHFNVVVLLQCMLCVRHV